MFCPHCGTENEKAYRFCKTCGKELDATLPLSAAAPAIQELSEIDLVRQELDEEYEILEELGRGGMAIVFRAREKQLDRDVALKVLPFSLAFDKEFVERFQREARTSAKLEHPHIIPIYRVGKHGRVIFFVMKFLRGKPLSAQLAARGALPPVEIRAVLVQVARALAYAHRHGIVHRDIKPDNIMFDEHGQAVVTDFGIAKAASGGRLTGTGMAIGTPHYMSPEQARAQALDGRSDIYSLGVVAYQCLVGQVPYDGEDSFSIGYKHIMEELPTPRFDTPEQRELYRIIQRMMAKQPGERFQTADELADVLEGEAAMQPLHLSNAQTRAIPSPPTVPRVSVSPRVSSGAPTTPLPRQTALPPGAVPEKTGSTGAALFIWALVVCGALGGGYYAWSKGMFSGAEDRTPQSSGAPGDSSAPGVDSARGLPAVATTGSLVLDSVPADAQVAIDGVLRAGTTFDLPPRTYLVEVAAGKRRFSRQVTLFAGGVERVVVRLEAPAAVAGSCREPGPAYNFNKICFDVRPLPLAATLIKVPADATEVPAIAIFDVKVSAEGQTLEVRVVNNSNTAAATEQAKELVYNLRWNPATKNGEPVEGWTQLQVRWSRE